MTEIEARKQTKLKRLRDTLRGVELTVEQEQFVKFLADNEDASTIEKLAEIVFGVRRAGYLEGMRYRELFPKEKDHAN